MKEINNEANQNSSPVEKLGGAEYINLYKQFNGQIKAHSAPVLNALRDASFELFEELGFPTSKLENYKYSAFLLSFLFLLAVIPCCIQ